MSLRTGVAGQLPKQAVGQESLLEAWNTVHHAPAPGPAPNPMLHGDEAGACTSNALAGF